MTRVSLIILFSVFTGIVMRRAMDHISVSPATPVASSNPDIAVQLRALTGTTRPSKMWADDFATFVTSHPGQWVVGHCGEPCLSESEAGQQARTDAVKYVWPLIAGRMQRSSVDAEWLRGRVTADVVAGRLDADSLAEEFHRPYGTVWTESVLLNISADRLDALVNSYQIDGGKWRSHQIGKLPKAVVAGLVGVWLTYLFLNVVTKGYFTIRLRLAAALATVLGVAMLI